MPRLSSIIPVLGTTAGLEATLLSLLEHGPDDGEVIVVLAADYDDPYDLKQEIRFLTAPPGSGWVDCVNLGLQHSAASLVLCLATGCEVQAGTIEAAMARFANPRVAAVRPAVDGAAAERLRGGGGLAAANFACFYRRSALDLLGGELSSEVGDPLAETDLALGLQYAGLQCVEEPNSRIVVPEIIGGTRRSAFRHGLESERLFWRNLPATGWIGSLAGHPWAVLVELTRRPWWTAPAQLLGRLVAFCQLGSYTLRHERLRHARAAVAMQTSASTGRRRRIDRPHPVLGAAERAEPRAVQS